MWATGQACHIQPGPTKLGCDRGSTKGRFGVYLPLNFCTSCSTLGLLHGGFTILPPNVLVPSSCAAGLIAQLCSRVFRVQLETMFNHTVSADFSTLRFFAFLPIVVTESLKTNVRVCFAQPSHSGAECDPRHRGAVFCIGKHPPQLATFHRISTGSH